MQEEVGPTGAPREEGMGELGPGEPPGPVEAKRRGVLQCLREGASWRGAGKPAVNAARR